MGRKVKVLRLPCSIAVGPVAPSNTQLRRLPILEAHEAALQSQKMCLDAAGLLQTFEPLQQLVQELQGLCAQGRPHHEVLAPLFPGMGDYDFKMMIRRGMQELPEDLRWLKKQVRELHVQLMLRACTSKRFRIGWASSTVWRR